MKSLLNRVRDHLDHVVFLEYAVSAEALALFRISYSLYFILVAGVQNFTWISENPDYFFNPPPLSIAAVFSAFPPHWFLVAMSGTIAVLYAFLVVGYHTRIVSVLLSLLLVLGYSFTYSFGKIDHNILQLIVPVVMAASGWGNAYSLDSQVRRDKLKPVQAWPLALLAWFLCFAFFTSGVPKVLGGWLDPATQAVRGHLVENYYIIERTDYLAEFFLHFDNILVWEFFDWSTVIFELGFFICVFNRRVLHAFIAIAVGFHMMNLLILNIGFLDNFTTYIGFLSWGPVILFLKRGGLERRLTWLLSYRTLVIAALLCLFFLAVIQSPFYGLMELMGIPPRAAEVMFTHCAALLVVSLHVISSVRRYLWERSRA